MTFGPAHQGAGLATEALGAVVNELFADWEAERAREPGAEPPP